MKVEIKREKGNIVKLNKELQAIGVHMENIYIDDKFIGAVGIYDDADRDRCVKTIELALKQTDNDIYKAMQMLNQLASFSEKEVSPDEEVEVDGHKYYVSYKEYKLYNNKGEEIANCDDLDDKSKKSMTDEVVKTLLLAKVNKKVK